MKPPRVTKNDLEISRRNLPHWQIGGSWYFVTFRTKDKTMTAKAKDIVISSILRSHGTHYRLAISTVMPDHVHLLFKPLKKAELVYYSLQEILKPIKGATARRINQLTGGKGSFWLDESFDRIVRDEKEWNEKYDYIKNNAFKAGLVNKPENYKWLLEKDISKEQY